MKNSPYRHDYSNLKDSEAIDSPVLLLKLELGAKFCKIVEKMQTKDVLEITGLDRGDLSRIQLGSVERFSLDRLIKLISSLGYKTKLKILKDAS